MNEYWCFLILLAKSITWIEKINRKFYIKAVVKEKSYNISVFFIKKKSLTLLKSDLIEHNACISINMVLKHVCFDTIYMCIWKSLFIFSVLCIAILLHHISNLGIVVFRIEQYTYSIIMLTILTFVLSRTKACSIRVWSGFLFILQENLS